MMRTILVLAGDFSQAQEYIRAHRESGNRYYYASGPAALAGLRADVIDVVGTFWSRSDAGKLYEFAQTRLTTHEPT